MTDTYLYEKVHELVRIKLIGFSYLQNKPFLCLHK